MNYLLRPVPLLLLSFTFTFYPFTFYQNQQDISAVVMQISVTIIVKNRIKAEK